ncbi:hypothetical protein SH661x_000710 [Planctomicrobium sp. SH661]|uniref:hypothetical protein n=1 Tax=Planctomicrobium sp. SH661 TaxID=3448124 RepID=UPI003F5BC4F2
MNDLRIETEYDAFYPGTIAAVTVFWDVGANEPPPTAIEVRLVWNTQGKGDSDLTVVKNIRLEPKTPQGQRQVRLQLPWGPYSFSGKLISLIWAIEVIIFPSKTSIRKEIVMGPNSEEVLIGTARNAANDPVI